MVASNQADLFSSSLLPPQQTLTEAQKIDWLRLWRTDGIGAVTFRELLNHFGSASEAAQALEAGKFGKKRFQLYSLDQARYEIERTRKFGAEIVAIGEHGYPPQLAVIEGAPPLLCVKGRLSLSKTIGVAIVGSRNASASGLKFTSHFSSVIGAGGFSTVSGLARGIDAAAHEGSLSSGTIAVLGGGLDHIYPKQNIRLYERIAEDGLLVSELPLGYQARAQDFPRRNRLISGIAVATVVVEAALRSGSLSTARFAGEQGRDVFAVPGHPLDPRASGTNKLIQDGAGLVTRAGDVIEALQRFRVMPAGNAGFSDNSPAQEPLEQNDPETIASGAEPLPSESCENRRSYTPQELTERLTDMLGPVPVERDSLIRLLCCEPRELQVALLELDLSGRIEHHGQQRVSLKDTGQ